MIFESINILLLSIHSDLESTSSSPVMSQSQTRKAANTRGTAKKQSNQDERYKHALLYLKYIPFIIDRR